MINFITIKIDCEMDETTLSDTILENKKYYDIKTVGFNDKRIKTKITTTHTLGGVAIKLI